ncbi:Leucine Rich Repeat family protein [Histomonas meleagridis]|uniref:Leucine Rich Repeat family protein n=1 Tax=Histomonas meleagridis TaxID=135588 RepID=UPI003559CF41|nr:Leucine Rich Repeat family protein [Histomonas meleagridis]KAH0806850.1 Leucine Rich Repeat family protein [Histomonas meleagridis]
MRDNGLEYSDDEYKRFLNRISPAYDKGILNLSGQRIGINVLTKLTKVLRTSPHIRKFNFYGNLIRDHGMHTLLQLLLTNTQVEVIDIGCNDLTNQAVPCLIDIIKQTNIKSLQLGVNGVAWHTNKFNLKSLTDIINAVHQSNRIECLGLNSLKFSIRQGTKRSTIADYFAEFIREDNCLKSLSLSDCDLSIKEEDIVTADGLLTNGNIKFLDYHENQLADPVGPNFLSQLHLMTSLCYINLRKCNLSSKCGAALAEAFNYPSNVSVLNISENNLGDEGFEAFGEVLITNQTLTELVITSNKITQKSAPLLGKIIHSNKVLYLLDISNNPMGDECAIEISKNIGENDSLTKLYLTSCRISDKGAIMLSKSMQKNNALRTLKLNNNFLTRKCGYQILENFKHNESLFKIDLSSTRIDHFVIQEINNLCSRNVKIQKESNLQPLKKQLVQLSIQRTKLPEAEMRLNNLEMKRDSLERDVIDIEEEMEAYQMSADTTISNIQRSIQNTQEQIDEENKRIMKIAEDTQKMIEEYDNQHKELQATIEKENMIILKLQEETEQIEKEIAENDKVTEDQQNELISKINEIDQLYQNITEIMQDPEQLKNFQPPKIPPPFGVNEDSHDAVFLQDEILEKINEENKATKRGHKKRKATKKFKTKKSKTTNKLRAELKKPLVKIQKTLIKNNG